MTKENARWQNREVEAEELRRPRSEDDGEGVERRATVRGKRREAIEEMLEEK